MGRLGGAVVVFDVPALDREGRTCQARLTAAKAHPAAGLAR